MPNKLENQNSLYLRQHAQNPVEWYPWSEDAFKKAEREDKPVFLSIGYSSCHWCHVMAHESFQDKTTAEYLNKHFVCIKVDREERPDIDRRYMLFVQALTGSGGWPLSVFLTPQKEPFYGGTYFPPKDMGRMLSFRRVLEMVLNSYKEAERGQLGGQYRALAKRLERLTQSEKEDADFDQKYLKGGLEALTEGFDYVNGGSIGSPKFPQHSFARYLLRHSKRFRDPDAFTHAELTLRKISRGGVYDQLAGGLHRYSVDAFWRVPHFEKMLYDQAQYLLSLCDLYQANREEWVKDYIDLTCGFLQNEMYIGPGFASSLDADTGQEEGAYYVWSTEELNELFKGEDFKFVVFYFDIMPDGNFQKGKNVLSIPFDDEIVMEKMRLDESKFRTKVKRVSGMLKERRDSRTKPGRDKKAITSWNALTATALLRSWEITGEHSCYEQARGILERLMEMVEKKSVPRLLNGTGPPGFLDDHVFTGRALMQGFLSTGDPGYLKASERMVRLVIGKFYEEEKGAFSYVDTSTEMQLDDVYDHELPSSTSEFILLLLEHHAILLKEEYHEMARKLLAVHQKTWMSPSPGSGRLLCALDAYLGPIRVAVVADGKGYKEMLAVLREGFDPNLIVLNIDEKLDIPIFKERKPLHGHATVYLCQGHTCTSPATDPEELEKLLNEQ